ncbi:MAG: fibrobacter succinogenes major paralogous domain-containing protein, partial [Mediterranea sp.]|nr:fibrobacter succinogenes major paralogous domain-containing protein [Mediterranea sp.]
TGRTFTFTADGNDYIYNLPDNVNFEPDKVYAFTFTLESSGDTQASPDDMTNCYMVIPGETLEFPVSRAYKHEDGSFTTTLRATDENYTGEFKAKVVWDDAGVINGTPTVTGSGNTAVVSVQTKSTAGNAVVKIYKKDDSSETPVWSYHIWVTGYTGSETWPNNGFTFMDRNLGATEAALSLAGRGLFYQWGRKDPFPGGKSGTAGYAALDKFFGMPTAGSPSTVNVSSDDNAAAIVESIQKPTTFFINKNTTYYNWLPAPDNMLWNTSENKKTIYDPCPAGWRVPVHVNNSVSDANSPWAGVSGQSFSFGDTSGVNWGTNALYPAAGYRNYSSGFPSDIGTSGDYWSASPSSSSSNGASNLYFFSGYVFVSPSEYRAYGHSVRCVKE